MDPVQLKTYHDRRCYENDYNDLHFLSQDVPRYTFGRYESIKLPVKSTFERITIDPKLAAKINPIEVRPGIAVASITGNLVVTNNK